MSLSQKYDAIIIPVGSFQLFPERNIALKVLQILHSHLNTKGFLLLDTFIPWETIKQPEDRDVRQVYCKDDSVIKITSNSYGNRLQQISTSKNLYEKFVGERCVESEDEKLSIPWYHPYEMELFLEKAGFQKVLKYFPNFSSNPDNIVYQAYRTL